MGLGPPVIALYRQLKGLGVFDGVQNVIELGAQNVWCPKSQLVKDLFAAFGRPEPPPDMLERFANWKGSGRELHEALGMSYACIDLDPSFQSIPLDLNFDPAPADHVNRYDLVTNHGTSEHLLNQYNVFKLMHDLTKVGGYMIHAVPFTVHLEHGYFNYQPNFFESLARYNSYKVFGIWIGPDWQLASFIPWEPQLLDYLTLNSKTTHLLVVLLQKMYDTPFCVPFQGHYESMIPDEAAARYAMVVDGELYDGKRFKHITKDGVLAEALNKETTPLKNLLASAEGQLGQVKHDHAVLQHQYRIEKDATAAEIVRLNIEVERAQAQQTATGAEIARMNEAATHAQAAMASMQVEIERLNKVVALGRDPNTGAPLRMMKDASGRELLAALIDRIHRRLSGKA